jgi:small subunit ribosomal protein S8
MNNVSKMLAAFQTAQIAQKEILRIPKSRIAWKILTILLTNGFLHGITMNSYGIFIHLKQLDNGNEIFQSIQRVSCPVKRIYVSYKNMIPQHSGFGLRIVSTSQGILSESDAIQHKIGGEIICEFL